MPHFFDEVLFQIFCPFLLQFFNVLGIFVSLDTGPLSDM